jgi:hypothetical protein
MFVTNCAPPPDRSKIRSESQEERVYMLNMALIEKGVVTSSSHYELAQRPAAAAAVDEQQHEVGPHPRRVVVDDLGEADDDGGILL